MSKKNFFYEVINWSDNGIKCIKYFASYDVEHYNYRIMCVSQRAWCEYDNGITFIKNRDGPKKAVDIEEFIFVKLRATLIFI
jgi:hypothetical protein